MNEEQSITYEFLDSTITRAGEFKTTFDLIPKEMEFETNFITKKVTKINLEIESNRQSFLFSSTKDYGIKDLVVSSTNN